MKVDGANLLAYERLMSEGVLSAFRDAIIMLAPSTQVHEIESGGFPTASLKVGRIASPAVPGVVFKAAARISSNWLAEQSKDWASKALVKAASQIAVAMGREAVSRPNGTSVVGVDRSSVSAQFDRLPDDGFVMRFSVGLAIYPPRESDDIVVDVTQEIVDLGMFEVDSKLPDETETVMGRLQDGIRAVAESSEIDGVFSMLAELDSADDLFF